MNATDQLNRDCWTSVFGYLGFRDRAIASRACRLFRKLITEFDVSGEGNREILARSLVAEERKFNPYWKVKWISTGQYYPLAETVTHYRGDGHIALAVENEHPDVLDLMISLKGDIDAVDSDGRTALRNACDLLDQVAVEKLLGVGAKLDGYQSDTSPLLGPLTQNSIELVRLLVERGLPKENYTVVVNAFRQSETYKSSQEEYQDILAYLDRQISSH